MPLTYRLTRSAYRMIVKCEGCGSEYEMPDLGVIPIMKDCPVCKQAKKAIEDLLKEIGF